MSSHPLLSINIPTYNRVGYLKEALEALLPQLTDEVEINVTDNHSTDETWEYLGSLKGRVNRFKPPPGATSDHNILSCTTLGRGQYTWIHCDDDVALLNAAENILIAIKKFSPPALYLQWQGFDHDLNEFVNRRVTARWKRCDKNQFLQEISYRFTFASAIVIKRGCADLDYIVSHSPISLIPGNIIFATVGKHNDVVISQDPLLAARASRVGSGGDFLSVFSRKTIQLFEMNKGLGYDPAVLKMVYREGLKGVVVYALETFTFSVKGLWNVVRSSFTYKEFYTHLLPVFGKVLRRKIKELVLGSSGQHA